MARSHHTRYPEAHVTLSYAWKRSHRYTDSCLAYMAMADRSQRHATASMCGLKVDKIACNRRALERP